MAEKVFLGLGSNLGDRLDNLHRAAVSLPPAVQAIAHSPIYQTAPWGYTEQPAFLNQVIQVKTELEPVELLFYLKEIELRLGRQQTFRYGPRLIDLDILFFDDLVIDEGSLSIPHPRLHERAFVLVPLAELAPDFIHPVFKTTISVLLSRVDQSQVQVFI